MFSIGSSLTLQSMTNWNSLIEFVDQEMKAFCLVWKAEEVPWGNPAQSFCTNRNSHYGYFTNCQLAGRIFTRMWAMEQNHCNDVFPACLFTLIMSCQLAGRIFTRMWTMEQNNCTNAESSKQDVWVYFDADMTRCQRNSPTTLWKLSNTNNDIVDPKGKSILHITVQ